MSALVRLLIGDNRVGWWQRPDWRAHVSCDRNYLHPIKTTAPKTEWGLPLEQAEDTRPAKAIGATAADAAPMKGKERAPATPKRARNEPFSIAAMSSPYS